MTYEQGVRDVLKFLKDNGRADLIEFNESEFIALLKHLSGRDVAPVDAQEVSNGSQ